MIDGNDQDCCRSGLSRGCGKNCGAESKHAELGFMHRASRATHSNSCSVLDQGSLVLGTSYRARLLVACRGSLYGGVSRKTLLAAIVPTNLSGLDCRAIVGQGVLAAISHEHGSFPVNGLLDLCGNRSSSDLQSASCCWDQV